MQFNGSMQACARNGISYSTSNRSPCDKPFATSPTDFAMTPSFVLAARRSFQMSLELSFAFGPSFQVMASASSSFFGGPHVIANDRYQVVEHNDLLYAGDLLGGGVVNLRYFAAEYRTLRKCRKLHSR